MASIADWKKKNENSPAAQWGISIILIVNHLKDYSNAVDRNMVNYDSFYSVTY